MVDKRTGRRVKSTRSRQRKSIYDLNVLFEKYYDARLAENLSKVTLQNDRNFFGYFLAYLDDRGIAHDVRNVTKDLIREYIAWTMRDKVKFDGHRYKPESSKTKGLSASSANNRLKTLRTFFAFLVDEGLADFNPASEVKYVKENEEEPEILTVDELRALLNAPDQRKYADFRDYVIMNVLIDGFSRINETLLLTRDCIHFDQNSVTFRASTTKGRKSRVVPLSKRTMRLLRELMQETEEFENEYIFLSNYGERLTPNHFRKRLKQYAQRAGIKRRVHPHLFRHTAATMALDDGMDSEYLRLIMGHTDDRSIKKYVHLSQRAIAQKHSQYSPMNRVLGKLNKERKIKR